MIDNVLKAPKGYRYTNGTDFGKKVALGNGADENSWYLITEEEYQQILANKAFEEIIEEE